MHLSHLKTLMKEVFSVKTDIYSVDYLTELFRICGESGSATMCHTADKLWVSLTQDNPELPMRRELNKIHQHLRPVLTQKINHSFPLNPHR